MNASLYGIEHWVNRKMVPDLLKRGKAK